MSMTSAALVEPAARPTGRQLRRLARLVADAIENVPFYGQRYAGIGLTRADLAHPELLSRLPVLTKAELLGVPLEQRRNRRFARETLAVESSTGSTGQPFAIYVEAAYRRRRNLRFGSALVAAGYRPWQRLMLLTDRLSAERHLPGRRHYVPVEQPTDAILEAYARIRPAVLYGLTTPLRLLGERLLADGAALPGPGVVVTTAEVLDARTRATLETAFRCPVVDFYGMTEMGLVAWQRPGSPEYVTAPGSTLTELVPLPGGTGRYRLLMTNLELRAAPMIRFDTGDIAHVRDEGGKPAIVALEGRRIDTVVCRDGSELSPYRITDAFRDVPGVRRFRIRQESLTGFRIELEAEPEARAAAARSLEAVFEGLLGPGLALEFVFMDTLIPDGARKFRPVESRVTRA